MTFIESLRSARLLGILRGIEFDELPVLADACKAAKVRFLEVTMNTSRAPEKLRELIRLSEGQFQVGAGTVLSRGEYRQAIDAGATFIVSPVLVPEIAECAKHDSIPFLPGALTPQEVYNCVMSGAAIVKLFPIQCFGPNYIRELRGPFGDIPLLACGGIRPDNLQQHFDCGADAVALGSGTFKREWLQNRNLVALTDTLKTLVDLAQSKTT